MNLADKFFFGTERWSCGGYTACCLHSLWPGSWLPAVDKGRGSVSRGSGKKMMIVSSSWHPVMFRP